MVALLLDATKPSPGPGPALVRSGALSALGSFAARDPDLVAAVPGAIDAMVAAAANAGEAIEVKAAAVAVLAGLAESCVRPSGRVMLRHARARGSSRP